MMLLDTTLREGLQAHGVQLPDAQRLDLARSLAQAGIQEIEVGCVGRDSLLGPLAHTVKEHGSLSLAWCPCRPESIRAAPQEVDGLCLSIPASDPHLEKRLGMSRLQAMQLLTQSIAQAQAHFDIVYVGLEDATRADPQYLHQLIAHLQNCGVQRVRIADTLGLLDPAATTRLFTSLCGHFPISFGFHGHNDFGMATANALAAAAAGAQCVDVSLMGLGERAGIAATEEVVGWQTLQERHSQIQLSPIIETAKSLARQLGLAIAPRKPMLGSALFRCESGMHVDGIQKDPQLYEPFAPELIGARRRLDVGSKTGRSALRGVLRHLGLHVPSDLDGLVEKVRSRSRELGRPLHQGELRHMVHP